MGFRFLSAILWASLSLNSPTVLAQTTAPTPTISPQPSEATTSIEVQTDELLHLMAQWLIALGLLTGAIAIGIGVYRYNRNERWQRIEFLRKIVQEFEGDPDIWNALKILDSQERRDYEFIDQGKKIEFQVTDELLFAALASRQERVEERDTIENLRTEIQEQAGILNEQELEKFHKHLEALQRNYVIHTELRNWFNKMLNGLEHFGYFIESGMFTAKDIYPWMSYWIRLIADQKYKQKGASKFYDQLYSYIHASNFPGVLRLFESSGYRIIPTPYKEKDFIELKPISQTDPKEIEILHNALSLAKAAYLVYQDKGYIKEISMGRWHIEAGSLHYYDNPQLDTQACLFKTKDFIVLAFRGSQEIKDWRTNFRTRLRKITVRATTLERLNEDWDPPVGKVHRGFQSAWEGVQDKVIDQIKRWNAGQARPLPLLIAGHSLGGALATVAAASLVKRKFDIQGLYTFGQPRVGDLVFAAEIGKLLKGKVFRFVNNNDIVPHVPPPYLPWNPFRIYSHLTPMLYFDGRGNFTSHPNPIFRLLDFTISMIQSAFEPGFDPINDHRMEFYISNLEKALKVELEKQALEKEEDEPS